MPPDGPAAHPPPARRRDRLRRARPGPTGASPGRRRVLLPSGGDALVDALDAELDGPRRGQGQTVHPGQRGLEHHRLLAGRPLGLAEPGQRGGRVAGHDVALGSVDGGFQHAAVEAHVGHVHQHPVEQRDRPVDVAEGEPSPSQVDLGVGGPVDESGRPQGASGDRQRPDRLLDPALAHPDLPHEGVGQRRLDGVAGPGRRGAGLVEMVEGPVPVAGVVELEGEVVVDLGLAGEVAQLLVDGERLEGGLLDRGPTEHPGHPVDHHQRLGETLALARGAGRGDGGLGQPQAVRRPFLGAADRGSERQRPGRELDRLRPCRRRRAPGRPWPCRGGRR